MQTVFYKVRMLLIGGTCIPSPLPSPFLFLLSSPPPLFFFTSFPPLALPLPSILFSLSLHLSPVLPFPHPVFFRFVLPSLTLLFFLSPLIPRFSSFLFSLSTLVYSLFSPSLSSFLLCPLFFTLLKYIYASRPAYRQVYRGTKKKQKHEEMLVYRGTKKQKHEEMLVC